MPDCFAELNGPLEHIHTAPTNRRRAVGGGFTKVRNAARFPGKGEAEARIKLEASGYATRAEEAPVVRRVNRSLDSAWFVRLARGLISKISRICQ